MVVREEEMEIWKYRRHAGHWLQRLTPCYRLRPSDSLFYWSDSSLRRCRLSWYSASQKPRSGNPSYLLHLGKISKFTIGLIALVENNWRPRRKAAIAMSWSLGSSIQLGLVIGLIAVSVELIVTFPLEKVATKLTDAAMYCCWSLAEIQLSVPELKKASSTRYSISG